MKPEINPGVIGPLLAAHQTTYSDRNFSKLLRCFDGRIRAVASSFPKTWQEDFIQEGAIGLYNALNRFSQTAPVTDFPHYATTAIRSRMIDFYRSTIGKFMLDATVEDQEGFVHKVSHPAIIEFPEQPNEEGQALPFEHFSAMPDYTSTLDLAIDLAYLLSPEQLRHRSFSERERQVTRLYYGEGYNTTTMATFLHTSISNASKIISRANDKLMTYLLPYHLKY